MVSFHYERNYGFPNQLVLQKFCCRPHIYVGCLLYEFSDEVWNYVCAWTLYYKIHIWIFSSFFDLRCLPYHRLWKVLFFLWMFLSMIIYFPFRCIVSYNDKLQLKKVMKFLEYNFLKSSFVVSVKKFHKYSTLLSTFCGII